MDNTSKLNLPFIMSAQAQKHVTHNEALQRLDVLTQLSAISRSVSEPPLSANDGDTYIVPVNATGLWEGLGNQIATFQGGVFVYFVAQPGWRCFVIDEDRLEIFSGNEWNAISAPTGAQFQSIGVVISLSGLSVSSGLIFPDRSIILGVTTRTVENILGPASYDVGTGLSQNQFGGSLNIAQGSENIGVIGPLAIYEDTEVIVTANGSAPGFASGSVELIGHYVSLG